MIDARHSINEKWRACTVYGSTKARVTSASNTLEITNGAAGILLRLTRSPRSLRVSNADSTDMTCRTCFTDAANAAHARYMAATRRYGSAAIPELQSQFSGG